jgi:hypothetical protein
VCACVCVWWCVRVCACVCARLEPATGPMTARVVGCCCEHLPPAAAGGGSASFRRRGTIPHRVPLGGKAQLESCRRPRRVMRGPRAEPEYPAAMPAFQGELEAEIKVRMLGPIRRPGPRQAPALRPAAGLPLSKVRGRCPSARRDRDSDSDGASYCGTGRADSRPIRSESLAPFE